jgi:hypothetical protein
MIVAAFLPWISGGPSASALDIPLEALWNLDAGSPLKLGSRSSRPAPGARLAVILGFALQLYRSIDRAGGTAGDVIDATGMGVVVALAGAVCLEVSK